MCITREIHLRLFSQQSSFVPIEEIFLTDFMIELESTISNPCWLGTKELDLPSLYVTFEKKKPRIVSSQRLPALASLKRLHFHRMREYIRYIWTPRMYPG